MFVGGSSAITERSTHVLIFPPNIVFCNPGSGVRRGYHYHCVPGELERITGAAGMLVGKKKKSYVTLRYVAWRGSRSFKNVASRRSKSIENVICAAQDRARPCFFV